MTRAAVRGQRGFSIVELMVASTISLIMFGVVIELFASNKEAYRVQEGASVLNENARYAVSHLQYYMRLADHWGGVQPENVSVDPNVNAAIPDCAGDGNAVISAIGFRGYNGPDATSPMDCISSANYEPNTDMFFIRYGASHEDGREDILPGEPPVSGMPIIPDDSQSPVQTDYFAEPEGDGVWVRTILGRRAVIFDNTDLDKLPGDVYTSADPDPLSATNYRFHSMLYYIRPCSTTTAGGSATLCDAEDDSIPALVRLALNQDGTFTEQTIVAGVENMQLLYGVDTNNDYVADRYDDATKVNDDDNWEDVVTVRVSLIVANQERDNTINDTGSYYMLDTIWTPPADARNHRRSQFDFTVQIRNTTRA